MMSEGGFLFFNRANTRHVPNISYALRKFVKVLKQNYNEESVLISHQVERKGTHVKSALM